MRRPARRTAGLLLAVTLLTGCAAGAGAKAPDWRPKPSFNAEGGPNAQLPTPGGPPPSNANPPGSSSAPGQPAPPSGNPSGPDPVVLATKLGAPTAIALLPDGSALVGERRTGRIVRVQPRAGQPVVTVRTLPGVEGSGDGGLLDLALSATYAEDNLIYAYLSTPTDNRVVDFTLNGPVTPVLAGIPKGTTGNTGRLLFGADGNLYIGTGDAGTPGQATVATSLAGKILRVDAIGRPADGNPTAGSPVFNRGHRVVDGLCLDHQSGAIFQAERGRSAGSDEVNAALPGRDYGWPPTGATGTAPEATLAANRSGVGGCAVLNRQLYVTSRDGQALMGAPLKIVTPGAAPTVGDFADVLTGRYGRLLTVVAAPDGALWLTTTNRDGHGTPGADDDRVLRVVPSGGGSANPPV